MSGRFKGLTVEYQKGKDKMNFEDTKKFTESVLKYGTSLDNANKVMDEAIGSVLMKSHRKAAELDKLEIQFKSLTDKGIKEVLQLVKQYGLPSEVETIEYSHKIKAPTEIAEYLVFCERHEYSLKLAIEMKTPQVAEIMEVIHTVSTRGDGTDDNPVRIVHQYWTKTGEMLAEKDCF